MDFYVKSILTRPGGTRVEIDGVHYHFIGANDPDGLGRECCKVSDPRHFQQFMTIVEGYRVLDLAAAQATAITTAAPPVTVAVVPAPAEPVTSAVPLEATPENDPPPAPETQPDPPPALPDEDALTAMDIEALRAQFLLEIGKNPSPKAKKPLLISQILASRAATTTQPGQLQAR